MPDDTKKPKHNKNNPKDQRKPRHSRLQNNTQAEKKVEKEETKKVPEKAPVIEPGPEFYQNLKRETDDILKITEEANAKYKKKEIQSNWNKYEIPVESYDEIEEQECTGADYAKLIEASLSSGGHFQFKHEKSWDDAAAPTEYDKYFDIYSTELSTALSCIPFFERNDIDKSIFSDIDISTMKHRTMKYKQKYFKDKSFVTPETEAANKILNSLKENENKAEAHTDKDYISNKVTKSEVKPILVELKNCKVDTLEEIKHSQKNVNPIPNRHESLDNLDDDKLFETVENTVPIDKVVSENIEIKNCLEGIKEINLECSVNDNQKSANNTAKPVLESPEDLEKWLDDFLDS